MESHHQLLSGALQAATLGTLAVAAVMLRLHHQVHARERAAARDGQALALAFARHLVAKLPRRQLRRAVAESRPAVFWAALEAFTDNIAGPEWERLSRALRGLPVVRQEILRLRRGGTWRRALAARHLGFLNAPSARPALRAALRSGQPVLMLSAALALARLGDRAALIWLLTHPDATRGQARHVLVALLKRFGPRASRILRRALARGPADAPISLAAVEVLGLRRNRRAVRRLVGLLVSGSNEPRIAAARALGRIGAKRAVPALLRGLDDTTWQVRAQAALALGEMRAEPAVPALEAHARDTSWWVRRHCAYALARIGAPGEAALHRLALGDDRYAGEMAQEVLQAMAWERESPGNVSRVG